MGGLFMGQISDERGSVLVAALLFMIILTLIGVAAMNTSTFEQQIAANDKFHRIAFQNADSGIYATPKIISACLEAGSEDVVPTPGGILVRASSGGWNWTQVGTAFGSDGTFYRNIMGFPITGTPPDPFDLAIDFDHDLSVDNTDTQVDVVRLGVVNLAGGGAEFATGAEGVGSGSLGSTAIVYSEDSRGLGPSDSFSRIFAVYRKVLGVPGGL